MKMKQKHLQVKGKREFIAKRPALKDATRWELGSSGRKQAH